MKAKKKFIVVAYDIASDKRRKKIAKALLGFGAERVNLSVMEVLLTESKLKEMKRAVRNIISRREDTVVFYPLDVNCFAQIDYMRKTKPKTKVVTAV